MRKMKMINCLKTFHELEKDAQKRQKLKLSPKGWVPICWERKTHLERKYSFKYTVLIQISRSKTPLLHPVYTTNSCSPFKANLKRIVHLKVFPDFCQ